MRSQLVRGWDTTGIRLGPRHRLPRRGLRESRALDRRRGSEQHPPTNPRARTTFRDDRKSFVELGLQPCSLAVSLTVLTQRRSGRRDGRHLDDQREQVPSELDRLVERATADAHVCQSDAVAARGLRDRYRVGGDDPGNRCEPTSRRRDGCRELHDLPVVRALRRPRRQWLRRRHERAWRDRLWRDLLRAVREWLAGRTNPRGRRGLRLHRLERGGLGPDAQWVYTS